MYIFVDLTFVKQYVLQHRVGCYIPCNMASPGNESIDIFRFIQNSDLDGLTEYLDNGGSVHVRNRVSKSNYFVIFVQ